MTITQESYSPSHPVHPDAGECTCDGKNHLTCPYHQHNFNGLATEIIELVKLELEKLTSDTNIDFELFKNGNWRFVTNNECSTNKSLLRDCPHYPGRTNITIMTLHPFCYEGMFIFKFNNQSHDNGRKEFELADPQFPKTVADCIEKMLWIRI